MDNAAQCQASLVLRIESDVIDGPSSVFIGWQFERLLGGAHLDGADCAIFDAFPQGTAAASNCS
jgi:hypothetical protein